MTTLHVPVVDLQCQSCDLAAEVGAALQRFGFFYCANHGIPAHLISEQLEQNKRLFALPSDTKNKLAFNVTLDIGYTGGTGTSQALDPNTQAADTKEGFMFTNNAYMDAAPLDPVERAKIPREGSSIGPAGPARRRHVALASWAAGLRAGDARLLRSRIRAELQAQRPALQLVGHRRQRARSPRLRAILCAEAAPVRSRPGLAQRQHWRRRPRRLGRAHAALYRRNAGARGGARRAVAAGAAEGGHAHRQRGRPDRRLHQRLLPLGTVITTSPRPRYSTAFFTLLLSRRSSRRSAYVTPNQPLRWPPMDTHVGEGVDLPER